MKEVAEKFYEMVDEQYESIKRKIPTGIMTTYMHYVFCLYARICDIPQDAREAIINDSMKCISNFKVLGEYAVETRRAFNAEGIDDEFLSTIAEECGNKKDELYLEIKKEFDSGRGSDISDIIYKDFKGLMICVITLALANVKDEDVDKYEYFINKFIENLERANNIIGDYSL